MELTIPSEMEALKKLTTYNECFEDIHQKYNITRAKRIYSKYVDYIEQYEKEDIDHDFIYYDSSNEKIVIDLATIYEIFYEGSYFMREHPFFDRYQTIFLRAYTPMIEVVPYDEGLTLYKDTTNRYFELDITKYRTLADFLEYYLPKDFQMIFELQIDQMIHHYSDKLFSEIDEKL